MRILQNGFSLQMLDSGYLILDSGYSIVDPGCSILDTRYLILDTGNKYHYSIVS